MAKPKSGLRWILQDAGAEFAVDPATLGKRLRAMGVKSDKDGTFSTLEIAGAVYGSLTREKIRRERAEADMAEMEAAEMRGDLVEMPGVVAVWVGYLVHARQVIRHSKLSESEKREILSQLKEIPPEDYFKEPTQEQEPKITP